MGFLDEISSLLGGGAGEQSGLIQGISHLLDSKGLSGLTQSFQEKGMGGIISSWIGKGENQPISADQLQEALGSDTIRDLAAKTGIPMEEVSNKLAGLLPGLVDKLTPDGSIPEGGGLLEKGLSFLKGKMS